MTRPESAPPGRGDRIDALLPLVGKPARYLGTEIGAIRRPWSAERVKWLLVLPDLYEIGMSHHGLRILYELLNRRDDALAERAFAPWPDMEARMRAARVPLFSLETRHDARDFDLIGFSLQYELLATNVLNMLDLAGLAVRARERGEDDPLIAAGGPCTGNPEPLADFIDFFLIGDGEEAVGEVTRRLVALRGRAREERLLALAEIPGVYVPRFYEPRVGETGVGGANATRLVPRSGVPYPVRRTWVSRLDGGTCPRRPILPLVEAVQDRLTLEIQRGCTQGCRFCQAGIFYRPVRERPVADLVDLVASGLAASGWDEISLSSLSTADYSRILPLARSLAGALDPSRTGLSLSSLRIDTFSVELAELVSRVRRAGLTFAPEAGTQRLRDAINKRVSESDLREAVTAAYARGWQRVKLYFMIGLPTETPADLDGIAALVRELRAVGRRFGTSRSLTVSLSPFVPKAHTPFQWEAFAGRDELRARIRQVEANVTSRWTPVKAHEVDVSFVEALLARGDRRMGAVIERVWRAGGRFEGWAEHFSIARWEAALREEGIDPGRETGARDPGAPLPWEHIDLGPERAWLRAERDRAYAGETTPDCRTGACSGCGVEGPGDARLAPPVGASEERELGGRLVAALGKAGEQPDGRPPVAMRLGYAKTGALRFVSHLETGGLLLRLLRMARWPLAFTSGHNPHPRVSFGPPLPLGVEGWNEVIDLRLTRPPNPEEEGRLAALAPPGLRFQEASALPERAPSAMAQAVRASYRVLVPPDLRARIAAEKRIERFHEAGALPVEKPGKGRHRTIDLKRCIEVLAWDGGSGSAPGGGEAELTMVLRLQEESGQVLGPLRTLAACFALSEEDLARCLVIRLRLLDAEGRSLAG